MSEHAEEQSQSWRSDVMAVTGYSTLVLLFMLAWMYVPACGRYSHDKLRLSPWSANVGS